MARPVHPSSSATTTTVALTAAAGIVILVGVLSALWRKRRGELRIPDKWRRVGTLSEVILYPLKSGALLPLDEAECTEMGLRTMPNHEMRLQDRLFIIVGPDGRMKTARQHQHIVLIKVTRADETSVTFRAPDVEDFTVCIPKVTDATKTCVTMWNEEKVPGLDCGDAAAKWFQDVLGLEGLRLVHYNAKALPRRDTSQQRFTSKMKYYRNFRHTDTGGYSDLASYMLINSASIEDLKERLGDGAPPTLSPRWFRPNFVVSGVEAFAEDKWDLIRIGDSVVLQNTKPCTRCIFTTVNPETGKKTENMEPLKTLRKYRSITDPKQLQVENPASPIMGINMGLRRPGIVRQGDAVYVPA